MAHPPAQAYFHAQTPDQLQHAIKNLAISVPPRGPTRTSDTREQWQIHRLLKTLLRIGQLHPPISLAKRQSPDFLLTTRTHGVGIEATEAINKDYAAATMHPNARDPNSVVDPSRFKWGTAPPTPKEIRNEAARTELTGDGWVGDSVEREFAAMVADIVSSKSAKLRDSYDRFDCDCLLIYHNHALPGLDIEKARSCADNKLGSCLGPPGFHTVYVDDAMSIIEFTATSSRLL